MTDLEKQLQPPNGMALLGRLSRPEVAKVALFLSAMRESMVPLNR